jgi:hypothetical protein
MIIDHTDEAYRRRWVTLGEERFNGAYYYSCEIVKNIIPRVKTDRDWLTINTMDKCTDGSIVFIHNNLYPCVYDWLDSYKDLILVCGVPETCEKVKHLGTPVYLPLSIDTKYVRSFRVPKAEQTLNEAYAGRPGKAQNLPAGINIIAGVPRYELLYRMARYKNIYAVGRTAIEAKALGCNIKAYDPRFPDPSVWKVLDNKEASKILQRELDKIDYTNFPY